ncbi:thiamine pyrophosphate-binding protein [Pseudomonas sp. WS 5106]|uniref:Thiamine pyrophosphate-binding protein n=1 Tax=Pseudomonas cremoris TaxID=2724178 RepID=A0A7X1ATY1_9PSED|nr:thiamine pyrophosphate-binding protein [Pseudomonas cremoris]MBC2384317.1 thiamine pyrophosphate-binding protein [Pseudomonas cremoris]MBC2410352.1 thiamine pyrophosphate-binding protein [Pseudomonas cremoris]
MTDTKKTKMTGGQIVVEYLIREKVPYVFGIPGHGNTALLDAFVDRKSEITLVPAMHEQGASHMADGFYRASGQIAAVCASIGPGATNTLTGIATAFADSLPQLVISGGVHTYMLGKGVLQELDRPHGDNFPRMAEPVVKRWWQPGTVAQLPGVMTQAFNVMLEGRRGPTLINLPQDLQAECAEIELPSPQTHRGHGRLHGDPADIARAVQLLLSAERPVIMAGGGVIAANASDDLVTIAEHVGAAVTTSFMGKGSIPEDHPLYAWPCGDLGSIPGNAMTREADVILAIGCRFSDRITSSYRPGVTFDIPNKTKLIQIDIDGFELGKNYPVEVGIVGDAGPILQDLLAALRNSCPARDYSTSPMFQRLQHLKAKWEEHLAPLRTCNQSPMTVSQVLFEARKILPRNTIVVTDSSNPQNQVFNEFPVYGPKQHITPGGFSGIGFALPAAIGAKMGAPNQPVVAICGDGAFLQTGQELATAVMMGVPAIFLIINNGGWGAIRNLQLNMFGEDREIITDFRTPDGASWEANIADFAKSLGAAAERVTDPLQIGAAVDRALASNRPYVIEAMCSIERPWSNMHPTGWWDITVPDYLGEYRDEYVKNRGF